MTNAETTPRPFVLFSVAVAVITSGVTLLAYKVSAPHPSGLLLLLVGAVLLSENYALEVPGVGSTSLSYPLTLAAVVLLGPSSAVFVAACSGVNWRDIQSRRPWPVLLFNTSQLVLSAALAGLAYIHLGGRLLVAGAATYPLTQSDFPMAMLPLLACAVVSFMINDLLVGTALHFLRRVPFSVAWRSGLGWMIPTQMSLAVVGFAIAQVLAIRIEAFILFLFPLVVARQVYLNYLSLAEAYPDSIISLINILEAKDPYTRGHSQRVAQYARQIAHSVGLDESRMRQLHHAAVVHDLGKLTLPRSLLTKAGRLTDDEYRLVKRHPSVGAAMVKRIPILADLAPFVEQHHERPDGRGYPAGITDQDLSLEARILAVADSYDAMTSARAYRPAMTHEQAALELVANSGTQFDSEIVVSFLGSLRKQNEAPQSLNTVAVQMEPGQA